jgi:disulfide bond formation protein DsbB
MFVKKYWWPYMTALGLGAWAIGQGLEYFGQWPACRLCHIERWIFLVMGIFSASTLMLQRSGQSSLYRGFSKIVMSIAAVGTCVAGYHSAIQFKLIALPKFCRIPDADTFDSFMALPSATCDQWTMTFLSLPMPLYLIFLFMGIGLVTHQITKQKPKNY